MDKPIYLDNNATTRIDPRVLEIMQKAYSFPANPSSIHAYGKKAKIHLTEARELIASYFLKRPDNLFFTPSGTLSLNLLVQGLLPNSGSILTTDIEHACIHETMLEIQKKKKYRVDFLSVGKRGAPTLELIKKNLKEDTQLMVFSAVYSETGAMISLDEIANFAKIKNIPLIIDGVALLGKKCFTIPEGVSGMAFSSHKIHGPKGVGLIYLENPCLFSKQVFGGGQEMGIFPGTENLEGILGFAKAVELLKIDLPKAEDHMSSLRDYFELSLLKALPDIQINADGPRICNTSNIAFTGIDAEALLFSLDMNGVYASLGSACSSLALEPSRALINMGYSPKRALSSIRFSLSRDTKKEEIDYAISSIIHLVNSQKMLFSHS